MMVRTTTSCVVQILLLLIVMASGPVAARDFLSVVANAPAVNLAPRKPGRNFVRLPTLEYEFEIDTACIDSRSPESLSLNVADTRKSLRADEIDGDGPTRISLKVPASQIAPLAVEDFCTAPGEDEDDGANATQLQSASEITIPAALSAQASLLCASDDDKAMTYISRTLDVLLVCEWSTNDTEPGVE